MDRGNGEPRGKRGKGRRRDLLSEEECHVRRDRHVRIQGRYSSVFNKI